ncbi:glycosyltransferase [Candidatus Roizmanbacteria bacterium]|nr:glycosyltransferase [Candidatus Roizmanbacteria bacterium]
MAATKQNITTIGIDGGDFYPKDEVKSGIQRLVKSFLNSLLARKRLQSRWFYYFFNEKKEVTTLKPIIAKNIPKRFFSSLFLPLHMLLDRNRVYLGFSGILPHLVRLFGRKSIVFIHDLGFYHNPQYYQDPSRMIWQTEYALYGANRIIVFSDYIKDQIYARFPKIPEGKIVRIYPGADHLIKPKKLPMIKEKFFLYVGVIKAAKNIELLLQYFSEFLSQSTDRNVKLILIGAREDKYYQRICLSSAYKKIHDNLIFTDKVSDQELVGYYLNCLALLNVSHEEGFCYPVIEALHLGRQVIVNDIPLYREFKPFFQSLHIEKEGISFVNSMQCVVKQAVHPIKIIKSPFTWSKFAGELLQVVDEVAL